MRTKWLPYWLPVVGLMACGVGLVLQSSTRQCAPTQYLCTWQGTIRDVGMMAAPLLLLLARGLYAGRQQLRRTGQVIQGMLSLPWLPAPPAVARLTNKLAITRHVDIVTCDASEAFCYGLLRPRICVTSGLIEMLSHSELEAVLRHERHHLQQYDPLRTLFWTILSGACWWLEERARHAHLLRELAADRAVIVEQGRAPLAGALWKLLTLPQARSRSLAGAAISGLSVTDARIDQIMNPKGIAAPPVKVWRWWALPGLLLIILMLCSTIMAHLWT